MLARVDSLSTPPPVGPQTCSLHLHQRAPRHVLTIASGNTHASHVKVKMCQASNSLHIGTPGGTGGIIVNGQSLKGLFATVADLDDDVTAIITAVCNALCSC